MQFVERVGRVFVSVSEFYRDINPSTLTGAIDVIVVEDPSGHYSCSPFHVRFGKLQVDISVNGSPTLQSVSMKVGEAGECFFVVESSDPVPEEYATSPLIHSQKPSSDLLSKLTSLSLDDRRVMPSIAYPLSDSEIDYTATMDTALKPNEKQIHGNNGNGIVSGDENEDTNMAQGHSLSDSELYSYGAAENELRPNVEHEQRSTSFWSWGWGKLPKQKKPTMNDKHDIQVSPSTSEERNFSSPFQSRASSPISDEKLALESKGCSPPSLLKEELTSGSSLNLPDIVSFHSSFPMEVQIANSNIPLCSGEEAYIASKAMKTQQLSTQNDAASIDIESTNSLDKKYQQVGTDAASDSFNNNLKTTINMMDIKKPGGSMRALDDSCIQTSASMLPTKAPAANKWQFWWKKTSSTSTMSPMSESSIVTNGSSPSISDEISKSEVKNKEPRVVTLEYDESKPLPSVPGTSIEQKPTTTEKFFYYKSLRLSSEQLRLLNLQRGQNTVTFSTSRGATCASRIFFWPSDCKIVISDVDGTITKSDVLGHLYTMVGKDWTHTGVARLYSSIKSNGYEILYLTSRAIGQADYTRIYLKNIEQESFSLPDGPVIMSPDRLLAAFHREVILKRPDEFKVACLKDIRRLFENAGNSHPFYAGFGNRPTDAISYHSVGIPSSRIFIINSNGEVRLQNLGAVYQSSYLEMDKLAEHFFPPISNTTNQPSRSSYAALLHDQWSDYHYWRNFPTIFDDDLASMTATPPSPLGSIKEKRLLEISTKSPQKNEKNILSIDTSLVVLESPFIDQSTESPSLSRSSFLEWSRGPQPDVEHESEGEEAEEHPYF